MTRLIAFVKTLFEAAPKHHHSQRAGVSTCYANPVIEAIVTQTIAPGRRGQVKYQGSWWTAQSVQGLTLLPGKVVYVISRQNLTLYVEPAFTDSTSLN